MQSLIFLDSSFRMELICMKEWMIQHTTFKLFNICLYKDNLVNKYCCFSCNHDYNLSWRIWIESCWCSTFLRFYSVDKCMVIQIHWILYLCLYFILTRDPELWVVRNSPNTTSQCQLIVLTSITHSDRSTWKQIGAWQHQHKTFY